MIKIQSSPESASPIVGTSGEHFVGQQWLAFGIVVALVVVIIIWRRWAAASRVGCRLEALFGTV